MVDSSQHIVSTFPHFHRYNMLRISVIGQYPDMFTAGAMRNPVISAGEMTSTDIPDWNYAEFGLPYPLFSSPSYTETPPSTPRQAPPTITSETFVKIQQAIPLVYAHKVRAAVLLLIGSDDLRVAPRQGMEYYHALKGRRNSALGVGGPGTTEQGEVELLVFEGESHPLEGVEAERVVWEAVREFLARARKVAEKA